MKDLAYYCGKITPIDEMLVSANDRGFCFGDGIYEAAMVRNYEIFALEEHLQRFYQSAELIRIEVPFTKKELTDLLYELVNRLDEAEQFLYWQLTRGTASRNHVFPSADVKPNLYCSIKPMKRKDFSKEYKLFTKKDTRFYHCNIKTLNLLPNVMAAQESLEKGCDECVFVRDGIVTECAHANISMLKDGIFLTHPADELILPGVERRHLLRYCRQLHIPAEERGFTVEELMQADEIIVSSTSGACMRAVELDGKPVGKRDSQHLSMLREAYRKEYEQQNKK